MALSYGAHPIQAATVFTENFSNGFEKWEPTRDDGSHWTIQDGKAVAEVLKPFTITELVPKDEYWNPAWKNITYTLEYTALAGVDKNISFHFENLSNWYELHFTNRGVELVRVQNGTVPWFVYQGASITNGGPHTISITLNEASISLTIDGLHLFTEVDPTFNGNYGKIGIKAGTGSISPTKIAIDNVTVETLENPKLTVPHITQTNPKWSELEYDSATSWSSSEPPTIGRWGCAITSMVMLFHYYGLTQFPDGTPLTPASFNSWLLQQPDGYLPFGNINWLAATRLSKELSTQFGTPKLEFKRILVNSMAALVEEVTAGRPPIVHIPNHFVVATGLVTTESGQPPDVYINDPGYEKEKLSQHQTTPLSLRTFTPSFTDLSYLLFVPESSNLTLELSGPQGLVSLDTETEIYASLDTHTPKPTITTYEYAKPEKGTYALTITGGPLQEYSLMAYIYLEDGTVFIEELTGVLGVDGTTVTINYSKSDAPQVATPKLPEITKALTALYTSNFLSSPFVRYELQRTLNLATIHPHSKNELLQEFLELLTYNPNAMTPEAEKYLAFLVQQHL